MQEQTGINLTSEKPQIVVYTAICGGKDAPRGDILCFGNYWQFKREVMNAKIYKLLSHKYVDTDISVWVDGNIWLIKDKEEFVKEFLGDADIAVWKHFDRDCVYQEGPAAKGLGGDYTIGIDDQLAHYQEIGFPEHAGLGECNVIVRRHTPEVERFNEAWWAEVCRWSCRDQLAFPVVASLFPNLKIKYNEGNVRNHPDFNYVAH